MVSTFNVVASQHTEGQLHSPNSHFTVGSGRLWVGEVILCISSELPLPKIKSECNRLLFSCFLVLWILFVLHFQRLSCANGCSVLLSVGFIVFLSFRMFISWGSRKVLCAVFFFLIL